MIGNGIHNKVFTRGVLKSFMLTIFVLALLFTPLGRMGGFIHADGSLVPDDGLRVAINKELIDLGHSVDEDTHDPDEDDLKILESLDASDSSIKDLTGLEHAVNLEILNLHNNEVADISPLSGLTSLKELDLSDNKIENIDSVDKLTNLIYLDISRNEVTDISAIEALTDLNYLRLASNDISDISPLAGLENLENLFLYSNDISDISSLSGLINLKELEIFNNNISDISALESLINLKELDLLNNKISDVSPLAELDGLENLELFSNKISDISPLKDLMNNDTFISLSGQFIELDEVNLLDTDTDLVIDNFIIYYDGSILDNIDVENGSYDLNNQTIKWGGLTGTETVRRFTFSDPSNEEFSFSGSVLQRISWSEVTKVELPTPELTEATCDVPEVNYFITAVEGVKFEVNGDVEQGGTITIIAKPDENIKLIATEGWELDDGYGFYEHTFDGLGNCKVEPETTEVDLPTPDLRDATCDLPEVYYFVPSIDGIEFEVSGDVEQGGTITIIAQPGENVELIATEGWELADGYGFYEYTFDKLKDCEKEEPTKPELETNDPDDDNGPEDDGKKLPKTSTNNFNMMGIGLASLLLGSISYVFIRRRTL